MKEKFLALIEKLKTLGIAAKFCGATNATQLSEEWEKFLNENPELVEEIIAWGQEFAADYSGPIFTESINPEDSKEVVIIIRVCNDCISVSECEIFKYYHVLEDALKATEEKVAIAVAGLSSACNVISEITAEEIFEYIENNLTDEDSDAEESGNENQENAETEENSDDGEAEYGRVKKEAEPGDDGYDSVAPCLGDYFDDDFDLIPGRE